MIVGDIGGTKTYLAHIQSKANASPILEHIKRYSNNEHDCFDAILSDYLMESGVEQPDKAVFAVAGPVQHNRCQMTNLPWQIDPTSLAGEFSISQMHLLNDLAATAHSLPFLPEADFAWLQGGDLDVHATQSVISVGTGLGEASLSYSQPHEQYMVLPGEGGHKNFAPGNDEELALLTYYLRQQDHVSAEFLISGNGIQRIYEFLAKQPEWQHPIPDMDDADSSNNRNQLITQLAFELPGSIYEQTVTMFAQMLMSEAGNLALQHYSNGGVVIAGGIAPNLAPFLQQPESLQAFQRKGRFATWLQSIPVRICLNTHAPLIGAWAFGQQLKTI